jgi:uncharacterized integral membrane protein
MIMKTSSTLLLLMLAAVAAFTVFNWSTFMTPADLSLGFTQFQAPLGMVMLSLTAILAVLGMSFVIFLQTSVLLEARRHAHELKTNRDLADRAEASRFTELHDFLAFELARQNTQMAEASAAVIARVEQIENTLLASLGELEDRLERGGQSAGHNTTPPY